MTRKVPTVREFLPIGKGGPPLRGVAPYPDIDKLTHLRGPSGILVMVARALTRQG